MDNTFPLSYITWLPGYGLPSLCSDKLAVASTYRMHCNLTTGRSCAVTPVTLYQHQDAAKASALSKIRSLLSHTTAYNAVAVVSSQASRRDKGGFGHLIY